jgi:hypothetical protein
MTQSLANRLPWDRWKKKTSKRRKSKKIEERQTKKRRGTGERWTRTNPVVFFCFFFFSISRDSIRVAEQWRRDLRVRRWSIWSKISKSLFLFSVFFFFFLFQHFRRKETIRDWWDMSALDTGSAADSFQLTSVAGDPVLHAYKSRPAISLNTYRPS